MVRNVYEEIHCIYKSITVLWGQNRVCLVIKSFFEYYFNNSEISFVLALDLLITGSNANLQCTFQCSNMRTLVFFLSIFATPPHFRVPHIIHTLSICPGSSGSSYGISRAVPAPFVYIPALQISSLPLSSTVVLVCFINEKSAPHPCVTLTVT